jgi:CheY-like chemotaxis protein
LVIDDDDDLRVTVAETLELDGYEVEQASSGEAGIARAAAFRPRLVLTDVSMPGLSGMDLVEYFRHDYTPPPPSLVVMSAVPGARVEALRRGAIAFLAKPFDAEELLMVMRTTLEPVPQPSTALDHFVTQKARTRNASWTMAEAAVRAGLATVPDMKERAAHLAKWLSGFYKPASVAALLPSDGKLGVVLSSDPQMDENAAGQLVALSQIVVETGSSLIVPDVNAQPWLGIASSPFRSILIVPFRYYDAPVGALCLYSAAPRELGAADLALMGHIASRAMSRLQTGASPVLADSWLVSRSSFRTILEIESRAASDHGEDVVVMVFRAPVDRKLGDLLARLPARRMQVGELRKDVVGLSVRARASDARNAAHLGAMLIRETSNVTASAALYLGAPRPPQGGSDLVAWAEGLLESTEDVPDRKDLVVDAHAEWGRASWM